MWAKWYIVGIGALLIAGGFFLASYQPSPSASVTGSSSGTSSDSDAAAMASKATPVAHSAAPLNTRPARSGTIAAAHASPATPEPPPAAKVPGNYTPVDHALARFERGLLGIVILKAHPIPTSTRVG